MQADILLLLSTQPNSAAASAQPVHAVQAVFVFPNCPTQSRGVGTRQ